MALYVNGNKVLEGSYIVATDGSALKPLADNTYYLGDATHGWKGIYIGADEFIKQYSATSDYHPSAIAIRNSADDDDCRIQCSGIGTGRLYTTTDNAEIICIQGHVQGAKTTAAYSEVMIGLLGRVTVHGTNTQNWTRATAPFGVCCVEASARILTDSAGTITGVTAFYAKGASDFASGATVTNYYHHYIENLTGAGITAGKLGTQYGIYAEALTAGNTADWFIYALGGASYHVGAWNNVGDLIAGGLDAAATTPADGTIRGSNVATGLSQTNQPGADLYIKAPLGTGTGDAGTIIFQSAQAAGTGDNIHTLETILTLDEDTATFAKQVYINSPVANGLYINNTTATLNKTSAAIVRLNNQVDSDTGVVSIEFLNDNAAAASKRIGFMGFAEEDGTGDGTFFVGCGVNETITERLEITSAGIATVKAELSVTSASSNGQKANIKVATVVVSSMSGATVTATNLIPAGSLVVGVTCRNTVAVQGAASYEVGDGTDADRWGTAIAIAVDTTTTIASFTIASPVYYASATSVVLTANTSNFTAGSVRITVHYINLTAATS